ESSRIEETFGAACATGQVRGLANDSVWPDEDAAGAGPDISGVARQVNRKGEAGLQRENAGELDIAEDLRGQAPVRGNGKIVEERVDPAVRVVEGSEATLGANVEGVLRRRVFVSVGAARVAELRRVGDRFR